MSLLALLTGAQAARPLPNIPGTVSDPEAATVPYQMPTAAPYNVPQYAVTPTPDGTGSCLHPDVVDMRQHGMDTWNGRRYWMAVTPWYRQDDPLENPIILHSDDGFTWSVPPGLTNPIDPPGKTRFDGSTGDRHLSDTDMAYDPATGRMWCFYRGAASAQGDRVWARWSTDGSTWSDRVSVVAPTGTNDTVISPAVVRIQDGVWYMFTQKYRRTAPAPEGPWSAPEPITFTGTTTTIWHLNAIWTGGAFWALLDVGRGGQEVHPAVSRDGLKWTAGPPVLSAGSGGWDDQRFYRSTLQLHPEGGKVRVWYSGHPNENAGTTTTSWRVAYTHMNAKHWTDLGG